MKFATVLLVALALRAAAQMPSQTENVIDVKDMQQCGLITRFPGDIIQPNCFQTSTNILSDRTGVPTRRQGYSLFNAIACPGGQPIRGLWPFYADNGISYQIILSSNSMFYSPNDGTCSYIPGLQGAVTASATMECVQSGAAAGISSGAHIWCTDGIDPVFATNVISTTAVPQAPTGYHIGTFRNRILVSGVPGTGSNGSGSQFYLSGELNGLDYTIPATQVSTSPAIISVNGINDGQTITCLMGEFQNQFLVGRPYDLWGLSGYDLTDFSLRKISDQVGCLEPRSVQEVTNVKYWLSHRGVEGFTGTQINRVSYPIDANILPIISGAGNVLTNSIAGQQAWQAGNTTASGAGAPLSTTRSPGNLTVSASSYNDITTTTYVSGTLVNVSTYGTAALALSISTSAVFDGQFALGTGWSLTGTGSANASNGAVIPSAGGATVQCPNSESTCGYLGDGISNLQCSANNVKLFVCLYDGASGSLLASNTVGGAPNAPPETILNLPISISGVATSTSVFVKFGVGSCAASTFIKEVQTTPVGFNLLVDGSRYCSGSGASCGGGSNVCQFLSFSNVRVSSYVPTGSYTSYAFNTGFSTPTMSAPTVSFSSSSVATLTLQQQNSSDGVSWGSAVTLSTAGPALGGKKYWRYIENWATSNGTTSAISNGLQLTAETTAYYITSCVSVSSPTSYGNFLVNGAANGGAFTFWISTGATCSAATSPTATWNSQIPNSIISVTTLTAYIAARALFYVDIATETPTLTSLTFTWTQGGGRPPTASAQWDDRYLLFYTTNTSAGAVNDHVYIYDQNQKWQLWDDEYAASAALINNVLYTGDSNATGYIYQQDVGQTDNGNNFTMTFQTADFDGGDPAMNKEFSRAYIMLGAPSNNQGSASLACSYALDGSTSTYSLSPVILSQSPTQNGYFVAKLAFNASQPVAGHWLNLTCSYTGSVGPVAVHRIKLVYTNRGWD